MAYNSNKTVFISLPFVKFMPVFIFYLWKQKMYSDTCNMYKKKRIIYIMELCYHLSSLIFTYCSYKSDHKPMLPTLSSLTIFFIRILVCSTTTKNLFSMRRCNIYFVLERFVHANQLSFSHSSNKK